MKLAYGKIAAGGFFLPAVVLRRYSRFENNMRSAGTLSYSG
jgi:hypothetical protein